MALWLAVGLAGALGAVARFVVGAAVQDRALSTFPFGTLSVNVAGSLILGVVAGIALRHTGAMSTRAVVGTGFSGGLTTWSTASWETLRLAEEGEPATAVLWTTVNLVASLLAGGLGLVAMRYG
jgi:CrcB protein